MVSQSLHVIDRLPSHVIKKRLVSRIHAASEHEILPDEDSHLIGNLIEMIRLINAAAPDADHIHVGIADRSKKLVVFFVRDARRKNIGRYPVRSPAKHGNAVDNERKALSKFIWLLAKFQRTKTRSLCRFVGGFAVQNKLGLECVQRLIA